MKKEIIQTFKIVSLGLILSAGFAFANTWNTKPSNPTVPALPSSNISVPIDVSSISQIKKGSFGVGPLVIAGASDITGNINIKGPNPYLPISQYNKSNLYVSGKVGIGFFPTATSEKLRVQGDVKISTLSHTSTGQANVCSDTYGEILLCPPVVVFGSANLILPGVYTWTVPVNVTSVTFKVWGGGGGGGGGGSSYLSNGLAGAGGGGGGYYSKVVSVAEGDTFNITVGSGGAGGSRNGSDSTGSAGAAGTFSKVVKASNSTVIAQGNGGAGGGGGGVPIYHSSGSPAYWTYPAVATGAAGGSYSGVTGGTGLTSPNSLSPSSDVASISCGTNGANGAGPGGGNGGISYFDPQNCMMPLNGSNIVSIPNAAVASSPGGGGGGGAGVNYSLTTSTSGKSSAGADGKVSIIW